MLPKPLSSDAILPWESGLEIEPVTSGTPGVSLVIPIFNAGRFLEKTIRSVLCNDTSGVEIIVMDGGSTDRTQAILQHYMDYFSVCISEKDDGQSDAINKGFSHATQPIFYWLNGDDLILPNTLKQVREKFRELQQPAVVVGDAFMTELDLTPIRHFQFSDATLRFEYLLDYAAHHLVQPSVFFNREVWETCGPVDNSLHYAMDADLFLRMSSRYTFSHLPVDIAFSVYHEECKTREKRAESIAELSLVQASHGGIDHARNTLDLLIDMYNSNCAELEAQAQPAIDPEAACQVCEISRQKLQAIENDLERRKELLLAKDMDVA